MKEKINFNNDEMNITVYKSMEIFDTIKDTTIKINSYKLNLTDKKYLSLLLGITETDNQVSKILGMLRYSCGISVFPTLKSNELVEEIYNNYFDELLKENNIDENSDVVDLMSFVLENNFIKNLHYSLGISMRKIKTVIYQTKENKKENKILKKEKIVK